MNFNELNLAEALQKALANIGYTVPTPIQQKSIPHILAGRDIFGCAQTGTGKTAAFALPILNRYFSGDNNNSNKNVRILVLAPTRELAVQISESFTDYSRFLNVKNTVIVGGVSQSRQERDLRQRPGIVIATPGRLLDLINQGVINLSNVEAVVLDEADRMLDMGFINDIRKIMRKVTTKPQMIMFSATIPNEIRKFADDFLKNPEMVAANPVSSTSATIDQAVYYVSRGDKKALLQHMLNTDEIANALVFTRTKRGADKVAKDLKSVGINAEAIHGNKSQNARQKALNGFKNKNVRVLVATDIASRGIDVEKLSHVINFELPESPETYVHRIGRTGRAGSEGIAYSFCSPEEKGTWKDILKLVKAGVKEVTSHPYHSNSNQADTAPKKNFSGRRPSSSSQGKPFFKSKSRTRSVATR